MRITVLLVIAIGGIVFLSTGLTLILAGKAAYRNTWELLQQSTSLLIESVEDEVRDHIQPAKDIAEYIATLVANGELDPANHERLLGTLKGAIAAAPQVAGVVLWDKNFQETLVLREPNGKLTVTQGETVTDPGLMRMINATRMGGKARWGQPGGKDGKTYINAGAPLFHNGEYWGVVSAGVTVSEFSSNLKALGRELDMTAFILFGDHFVLAHPELIEPGKKADVAKTSFLSPVKAIKDPVVHAFRDTPAIKDPKIKDVEIRELDVDGTSYLALSRTNSTFGDVPWHIGIYAPLDDLDDQVQRFIGSMIAGIGVLFLAIVCAIFLARRIARPILILSDAAERVGRLELDAIKPLPRSRIRELDEQSVAFNRMVEGLKWFETYVPKTLVKRLIADQGVPTVDSREAELTVMFTDIVGFTAITESMAPGDVAEMLNDYFEILGTCIEAEGGTLDKYIGDAVMAFWGAPEDQPDNAARACRAALRIGQALDEAAGKGSRFPKLRTKIALHTGPLLVGNIGARSRMNYTVIGDTVNTCSRIESLCSSFDDGGSTITLVSEDTVRRVTEGISDDGDAFQFEDVGSFDVKGRAAPVAVQRLRPNEPTT